mgnify:FL=1
MKETVRFITQIMLKILKLLVSMKLLKCNDGGWHRHYYIYFFKWSKRIYIEET